MTTTATTPTVAPSHRPSPRILLVLGAALLALAVAAAWVAVSQRGSSAGVPTTTNPAASAGTGTGGLQPTVGHARTGADAERHAYGPRALVDAQGTPVVIAPVPDSGTVTGHHDGSDATRHFFGARGDS